MDNFKELLEKDGTETINFLTDSLSQAFADLSDGALVLEFKKQFKECEIYLTIKKRGNNGQ